MSVVSRARKNIDMRSGNIYQLLITFALPLLLGDLFQQLYNLTDTWVIGNFATNAEYSAVGACSPILKLIIKSFIGLSAGAQLVISRSFGQWDQEKVKRGSATAAVISLVCAIGLTLIGRIIAPYALRITGVPPEIYHYAYDYLTIIFNLVSAQIIYNMGAGVLRSIGDSQKPFLFLVAASVVNVILDLYFVIKLGWGIKGVAWATAISQCISAVLIIIELFRTTLWVKIDLKDFHFDKDMAKEMIALGVPTAIQMGITALSNVFVQSYVNGLGIDFLSAHSTYSKTENLLFLFSNSIGIATMTFVSQNLGAGQPERARQGVKASMVINEIIVISLGALIVLFASPIAAFFNDEPGVVKYATLALRYITPFFMCQCLSQILINAIRGCGDTKTPMFLQLTFNIGLRQLVLFITKNYIAYTPVTVLSAQPISWMAVFIALLIAYRRCKIGKNPKL